MTSKQDKLKDFSGSGGGGGSRSPTRTPNNLLSQDYVEIIIGLCKGQIKGLVPGAHGPLESYFFGTTSVQNSATGASNFADFQITQYTGGPDDLPIDRVLGGDASNLQVGTNLAQNTAVVRTTSPSLRKTDTFPGLDRLEVRLLFSTLVKQNDDGEFNHTANFRIEYKASNSSTWLKYNNESTTSITGKTNSGYVKDFLIDVEPLTDADYDVRVTKLSPDNGTQEVVSMSWESLQCVTLKKPEYPGLAKMHIYGRVSDQFNSLPDMSGVYEGMLVWVPDNYNPVTRTYDESSSWTGGLVKRYTNNPAWILYYLIKSEEEGLARYYRDVQVILQEFYNAGKWCDEQVPGPIEGSTQPRFTFNELLDSQKLGMELLYYVAGAFNSTIYDANNGVIRLKTDQYRTPKMMFSPENVINGDFQYTFADISTRYNDVTVQFVNPDLNWEVDERSASIDASEWIDQNGRIPYSFLAVGCTDKHEAIRRANDRLLTCNTEVTTVVFETTRFGMLAEIFDTILVADPISGWSTGGRIKSYSGGVIQLRDPIYVETIQQTTLKVQTYSGISEVGVTPTTTGLCYSFNVTSGTYPSTNVPDRTVFTLENQAGFGLAKPFRVVSIMEVDGNPDRWQITAVEVNPNKYEDSANGTKSDDIRFDYTTPGEPVLPSALRVSNVNPLTSSDGTLIYRFLVEWTRPNNAFTSYYEVEYSEKDSGVWRSSGAVYDNSVELSPVTDGTQYDIRLWAFSPMGKRSSLPVTYNGFGVTPKVVNIESPGGLTVVQGQNGWNVKFNPPVNVPDFKGTRIKYSNPPNNWGAITNVYLTQAQEQPLPWFAQGTVRIQAKYVNTSNQESNNPSIYELTVLPPAQPTLTTEATGFGVTQIYLNNPATTQPLDYYLVRVGNASSTWDTATLQSFTVAANQRTFTVPPDAAQVIRVFVRAFDKGGNQGNISLVELQPAAGSVEELLDVIKGDIDETWITPGLLNRINYGDSSVTGGLAQRTATIETINATQSNQIGYLGAQWGMKITLVNGNQPVVGGVAIAGTVDGNGNPVFDFTIRSDKIAFMPPAGVSNVPTAPFVYYTTQQTINGVVIPPGMYIKNAFMEYVKADQIDGRGLTIRKADGTIIINAGAAKPIDSGMVNADPNWVNTNVPPAQGTINKDPSCTNSAFWTVGGNVTRLDNAAGVGAVGKSYFKCATGTDQFAMDSYFYPLDASKRYSLTALLGADPGNNRNMYILIRMFRLNGTEIGGGQTGWGGTYAGYTYGGVPTSDGAVRRYGNDFGLGTIRTIPSDAAYCQIGIWFQYGGQGSSQIPQYFQELRLEDVTDVRASYALADAANTAAGTANSNATNALSTANAANNALAVIQSDGWLSRNEKPAVQKEWEAIANEQAGIDSQANVYGITTEKNEYDSAVNALASYLVSLSPGWSDATTDTPIVPGTFKSYWNSVYLKRQALLNKIADEAGKRAVWANVTSRPKNFTIRANRSFDPNPPLDVPSGWPGAGIFDESGTMIRGSVRSYNYMVWNRDGTIFSQGGYDVYGSGSAAYQFASDMSYIASASEYRNKILAVYTDDEPGNNHMDYGIPAALYANGASPEVFSRVIQRSCYILLTICGAGQGQGVEIQRGSVYNDPKAWAQLSFQITQAGGYITQSYGSSQGAYAAVSDPTTGLSSRFRNNAQNVLAGGAGLSVGSLTWDGAGNYAGGYGLGFTAKGMIGYNSSGNATFLLDTNGNGYFSGSLNVGSNTPGTGSMQITGAFIKIRDGSNTLRVHIGDLSQ